MNDEKTKRQEIMKHITSLYELTFPCTVGDGNFYELAEEMLINLALTIHTHNHKEIPPSEEILQCSFIKKVEYVCDTYQGNNKNED